MSKNKEKDRDDVNKLAQVVRTAIRERLDDSISLKKTDQTIIEAIMLAVVDAVEIVCLHAIEKGT